MTINHTDKLPMTIGVLATLFINAGLAQDIEECDADNRYIVRGDVSEEGTYNTPIISRFDVDLEPQTNYIPYKVESGTASMVSDIYKPYSGSNGVHRIGSSTVLVGMPITNSGVQIQTKRDSVEEFIPEYFLFSIYGEGVQEPLQTAVSVIIDEGQVPSFQATQANVGFSYFILETLGGKYGRDPLSNGIQELAVANRDLHAEGAGALERSKFISEVVAYSSKVQEHGPSVSETVSVIASACAAYFSSECSYGSSKNGDLYFHVEDGEPLFTPKIYSPATAQEGVPFAIGWDEPESTVLVVDQEALALAGSSPGLSPLIAQTYNLVSSSLVTHRMPGMEVINRRQVTQSVSASMLIEDEGLYIYELLSEYDCVADSCPSDRTLVLSLHGGAFRSVEVVDGTLTDQ